MGCSSTITGRRPEVAQPLEPAGFYWSGFLCLILAILKLRLEAHWSWWRVLLPFWAVFGPQHPVHNRGIRLARFRDDGTAEEEVTIRQGHGGYRYQLAALVCFVIFADNVLRRIEGSGETIWFWVSSGRWELIIVFGILSVVLQLLFWSEVVGRRNRRIHEE